MDVKNPFLNSEKKNKFKPKQVDSIPKNALEIGLGIVALEAVSNIAKDLL